MKTDSLTAISVASFFSLFNPYPANVENRVSS